MLSVFFKSRVIGRISIINIGVCRSLSINEEIKDKDRGTDIARIYIGVL